MLAAQLSLKRSHIFTHPSPLPPHIFQLTLGQYSWMSYGEWGDRIKNFGAGLKGFSGIKSGDRMLIYAETQRDWMSAAFSGAMTFDVNSTHLSSLASTNAVTTNAITTAPCRVVLITRLAGSRLLACSRICFVLGLSGWSNNFSVVTAYATLGADGAKFAINQTKAAVVVADAKLLKVLLQVQGDCPCVKFIVTLTEVDADTKKRLEDGGVKVATFDELVTAGAETPVESTPPTADDIAVIMFTSGTTGVPKGVMISHKNIISTVAGLIPAMNECKLNSSDVYASYLPLAHVMEIISEINIINMGASMGYGNPHTLTDTGVKLAEGTRGDLGTLKPTFVVFAPLVLEKIYNSISVKTGALTGIKKMLFDWGVASGMANFEKGYVGASWFYNVAVFKKIQAMVGGNLKYVITGSAPLDGEVHKFIQVSCCCWFLCI